VWVFSQSLGLIKAGKIEQETRRRRGKRRKSLILSGKYLAFLRSPRLRASCSLFSSFGCPMRLNPNETPHSQVTLSKKTPATFHRLKRQLHRKLSSPQTIAALLLQKNCTKRNSAPCREHRIPDRSPMSKNPRRFCGGGFRLHRLNRYRLCLRQRKLWHLYGQKSFSIRRFNLTLIYIFRQSYRSHKGVRPTFPTLFLGDF
jgi:hypothetical protein